MSQDAEVSQGGYPVEIELSSSLQNLHEDLNNAPSYNANGHRSKVSRATTANKKINDWEFTIPSRSISLAYPGHKSNNNAPIVEDPKAAPFLGWEFASKFTSWKVRSQNILAITYTQSLHALPIHTNKNVAADYVQRVFKRSKCVNAYFKKPKVYVETYTAEDISSVRFLEKTELNMRGFEECQGVQVLLRNKNITETRFPYRFKSVVHNKQMPHNGQSILEKSGYDQKDEEGMDDGIPSPPWHDKRASAKIRHPIIVTFVMPNLSHKDHMESGRNSVHGIDNKTLAPPLLWKVQMPPDASIALEAFTVLDGNLDVHSTMQKKMFNYQDAESRDSYSDSDCSASHPSNIYINGYQSWSFAGSVAQGDEQPKPAMPDFLSKAFNDGADIPPAPTEEEDEMWVRNDGSDTLMRGGYVQKGCSNMKNDDSNSGNFHKIAYYTSDFYTCVSCNESEDDDNDDGLNSDLATRSAKAKLDEHGGPAMVLGFLSQRKQYGLITLDSDLCRVAMHASMQGLIASDKKGISTDWAYCQILPGNCYDEEPMASYLNAVSSYNVAKPFQSFPPLTGWCSWYHYYENIDSASLTDNFKRLADLKSKIASDTVIIDDGYMTAWGDWDSLKPKGFPKASGGMKALADSIESNAMIPGIWMAPYACDKNSKLAKAHPDWIIRNNEGRIANSSNCGKFFYGLDASNPAVREYAFKCIRRAVQEWGYKVLKLDFLYAACLQGNGKYDLSMSRADTMYLALQTLRAAAGPDTFIIGCGCPIGPAIGLLDANRISADTGPTWYADFPLPWWDHGTLPSLRAMVRNSITRSSIGHRFWHNDPDCILLGKTTRLTDVEIKSAATVIAMTGGMMLLSDDLSKLSNERLRVATRIHPVTGVTGVVLDLHNTSQSGIPSLMRLWCTDEIELDMKEMSAGEIATLNAKRTSFISGRSSWTNPWDRERNCLPVAKGLGSWSVVSLSNWLDKETIVSLPMHAALPPKHVAPNDLHLGYHVFSFWSAKYAWVSVDQSMKSISKKLGPHESEIFHVKPVSLSKGQFIGSELHFTCGYEVVEFNSTSSTIDLKLRNDSKRSGFVYVYMPCYANTMTVTMSGMVARGEIVFRTPKIGHDNTFYGGHVVRVWVVINGNGSKDDGRVTVRI
eukprot:scaffold4569_cov284-Chaetoceros_neogracile.AAC.16